MENDDLTTWHKENGLIAQELYYDAPELKHLVHKGKPETDKKAILYHYLKYLHQ